MRYVIQPGDTLSELAKRHNTTVPILATANLIADPNKIYAGRTIWLPDTKVVDILNWNFLAAVRRFFGWQ